MAMSPGTIAMCGIQLTGSPFRIAGRHHYRLRLERGGVGVRGSGRAPDGPSIPGGMPLERDRARLLHRANAGIGSTYTAPVGSFRAIDAFGLHDMCGTTAHVFEWVEDCWNGSYADRAHGRQRLRDSMETALRRVSLHDACAAAASRRATRIFDSA